MNTFPKCYNNCIWVAVQCLSWHTHRDIINDTKAFIGLGKTKIFEFYLILFMLMSWKTGK